MTGRLLKITEVVSGVVLAALFLLSLNCLTEFPKSFEDEGFYASWGYHYGQSGNFEFPTLKKHPAFTEGDTLGSRFNPYLFGVANKWFGSSLHTARMIPFGLVWLSVGLWFFLCVGIGFPPFLGSLLFASAERVFYASHVFRPEAPLLLMNVIFVLALFLTRQKSTLSHFSFRGLMNAGFMVAHGTGIVSVAVNSLDALLFKVRSPQLFRRVWVYGLGSVGALIIFYLVQLHDAGGFPAFFKQLTWDAESHGFTIPTLIYRDITVRWGRELIAVGGSWVAKAMRFVFYGTIFGVLIHSIGLGGRARRSGLIALGCVVGYMLLVVDKIDIHIGEMMPYLLGAVMVWAVSMTNAAKKAVSTFRLSYGVIALLLTINLMLTFHHVIKYRRVENSVMNLTTRAVGSFLEHELSQGGRKYQTFVGEMSFWFPFHDDGTAFISSRFVEYFTPLHGHVLAFGRPEEYGTSFVNCRLRHQDPGGYFVAYDCP